MKVIFRNKNLPTYLGIQDILLKLQDQNPGTVILAYLDDVFIVGPPHQSLSAFESFKSLIWSAGLKVCDHKCEVYGKALPGDCNFSPVGNDAYVSMSCVEKAESGHDLCSQLLQLDDLQSSYLLLKFCHLTHMNHLARTVSPPMFFSAAQAHHALSYQTLCSILGFDIGSDNRGLQSSTRQPSSNFTSFLGLHISDPDACFQNCLLINHEGIGLSQLKSIALMAS